MFERSGTFSQVTDSVCLQASTPGAVCVSKRERAHSDKGSPAGVLVVFECELGFMQAFSVVLCVQLLEIMTCAAFSSLLQESCEYGSALPLQRDLAQYEP